MSQLPSLIQMIRFVSQVHVYQHHMLKRVIHMEVPDKLLLIRRSYDEQSQRQFDLMKDRMYQYRWCNDIEDIYAG